MMKASIQQTGSTSKNTRIANSHQSHRDIVTTFELFSPLLLPLVRYQVSKPVLELGQEEWGELVGVEQHAAEDLAVWRRRVRRRGARGHVMSVRRKECLPSLPDCWTSLLKCSLLSKTQKLSGAAWTTSADPPVQEVVFRFLKTFTSITR